MRSSLMLDAIIGDSSLKNVTSEFQDKLNLWDIECWSIMHEDDTEFFVI